MNTNVIRSQIEEKNYLPLIPTACGGNSNALYDIDLQTRRNNNFQHFFSSCCLKLANNEDRTTEVKKRRYNDRQSLQATSELSKEMISLIQVKRGSRISEYKRREISSYHSEVDSECGTPRPNVIKEIRKRLYSYSAEKINKKDDCLYESLNKKNSNADTKFKVRSTVCELMQESKSTDCSLIDKSNSKKRRMTEGCKVKKIGNPFVKPLSKMPLPLYPNYKKKDSCAESGVPLKCASQEISYSSTPILEKAASSNPFDTVTNNLGMFIFI